MSFAVGEGVVESVGGWECGSVGVWECGSVGVWECGSVGVWPRSLVFFFWFEDGDVYADCVGAGDEKEGDDGGEEDSEP